MAATAEGVRLTEMQRLAQLRVASQLAGDVASLWPVLRVVALDTTTPTWIKLMRAVIEAHQRQSVTTATDYYLRFRAAETGLNRDVPAVRPATLDLDAVDTSLQVVGPVNIKSRIGRGAPPEQAARAALVDVVGAATRHVLDGGRTTILEAADDDREAVGWARVTDSDPCAFCAMLATRGAVYLSRDRAERTTTRSRRGAGQRYHDHCACTVEPAFDQHTPLPPRSEHFDELYREVTGDEVGVGKWHAFRRAYEDMQRRSL